MIGIEMLNPWGQEGQGPQISIDQRMIEIPVDDLDTVFAKQPEQPPQTGQAKSPQVQSLDRYPLLCVRLLEVGVKRSEIDRQEDAAAIAKFTSQLESLLGQRRELAHRIQGQHIEHSLEPFRLSVPF